MGFALPADFCVWAPTTRCRTGMPFLGGCEPCGGLWSGGAAPLGFSRRRVWTEGAGREKRPTRPGRQCFAPIYSYAHVRAMSHAADSLKQQFNLLIYLMGFYLKVFCVIYINNMISTIVKPCDYNIDNLTFAPLI